MIKLHNPSDVEHAAQLLGTSCGHAALAAILGMEVRTLYDACQDIFYGKGYVSQYMAERVLNRSGGWHNFSLSRRPFPIRGLVLLQWDGPWMEPGLPAGASLSRTHWIACDLDAKTGEMMVYDINSPDGWTGRQKWEEEILPKLLAQHPRNTGWFMRFGFHIANAQVPSHA